MMTIVQEMQPYFLSKYNDMWYICPIVVGSWAQHIRSAFLQYFKFCPSVDVCSLHHGEKLSKNVFPLTENISTEITEPMNLKLHKPVPTNDGTRICSRASRALKC